ncbi:hypothetical protein HW115_04590 [Verrucomicrobiaceae bacterium N1E253]|uniref:NolW-like domain-containing protein n=1 Tax=Oceaniferula marina TaxID=2748318 RepID=A0A851GL37_9BACT|nr:secretin N-terminal domain-containing protein [Oceaniferula marina]NWK54874.1 hypothetical protein [Oceaniferula marina]
MKKTIFMLMGGLLVSPMVSGQDGGAAAPPVVAPPAEEPADAPDTPVAPPADNAAGDTLPNTGDPVTADGEEAAPNPIEEADGGYMINDAKLNDIFQLLAKRANKQYFHNNKLNTEEYKVTGHLNADASPLTQMEELAFQYGLRMYVKGNTVYAMMSDQLEQLPAKEWTYSLRYLRPTDIEQIKALVQPMLTAGRGIVNYEPKTNTIVVIDTAHHIEMVDRLLRKIDKPKGQIVVEVKILRVNSGVGQNFGVDWSNSLGSQGVSIDIVRSLNSVFGLPGDFAGIAGTVTGNETVPSGTGNIILSPVQLNAVLRALNEGGLLSQKSNPVIITEDNEKAHISLIDRVPIITQTTSQGTSTSQVSEEVRYRIDESDSTDPDKTREIGVTIALTPSLLPDGTIRMKMRPRNAEVVEYVESALTGNNYPRVSEATVENIARIPDGNSLIVGGFYKIEERNDKNKVPLLGDIPVVNFFFKSKSKTKEQASLAFVVTPTAYNPACVASNRKQTERVRANHSISHDHDWIDANNPGPAHEANWDRTVRGMKPKGPVCYPAPPKQDCYPQR